MPKHDSLSNEDLEARAWHALSADEALDLLRTDAEAGLSREEAERRRASFGANRLTPQAERSALRRFANQFNNLFIYLLLGAGVVTAALGEWLDSGVILGVVLIIVTIGFVQEGRAERALEAVREMLAPKARVRREGEGHEIPAEELVPGDMVLLDTGDRAPADLRLLRTKSLQTQEAALTGESTAVAKASDPVPEDAELGDRSSMAYAGTVVAAGKGTGVVAAIGDATEIGRISGMLSEIETVQTPLTQRLDAFTKVLSFAILGLAAATFAVGVLFWARDWGEMFFAAVSIAVAAIPEGLPAVMTITLAIGVQRMARRNAIIRRMPAVETLGSVTIICSDKTGTLTKNEMTAKTLRTAEEDIEAEGAGLDPAGALVVDGDPIELGEHPIAREMIRAGLLCNDATVRRRDDRWEPQGDPTEVALIVLAHKAGLEPQRENEERPRVDAIPFASERRYMATLHRGREGNGVIYVKGAPERILEMCVGVQRRDGVVDLDPESWHERIQEIAGRGQRLLAVARKDVGEDLRELQEEDIERELVLLGLFGLIDPPREEAIEAVAACQSAGIGVKMVTGDHARTASAVARELGLGRPDQVLTGRQLEDLGEEELRERVTDVDVFARTSPEHKLRLVKALQAQRQVTAMTGDGVNDAPALKRADIGIAMGQKGTDAAREAAAMVLADDNFASIERAIEAGRQVYDNLRKAILFILPTNAAEASVIVAAIAFGLMLPVTPVQILWVNMITAVTLGLAFAFEPAEGNLMLRPPRATDEPLLTGFMLWRIAFVGLLLLFGTGFLFLQEQGREGTTLEFARTIAVNTLVLGQIFYLLNTRSFHEPAYTRQGLLGSRAVLYAIGACVALQLLFTYTPFMNLLFETEPLDAEAWMRCVAVGGSIFLLVELEKLILRSRFGASEAAAGTRRADHLSSEGARSDSTGSSDAGLNRARRQEETE